MRPEWPVVYDWSLFTSVWLQFALCLVGLCVNGLAFRHYVLAKLTVRADALMANLAMADALACIFYGVWAVCNHCFGIRITPTNCLCVMVPTLFAINASLCFSVAVAHHRADRCLKGYELAAGRRRTTESRWQSKAAFGSVWLWTLFGGALAFVDVVGQEPDSEPVCLYPFALHSRYLVPFAFFVCCVSGVVVLVHLKVLAVTLYAVYRRSPDANPRVSLTTLALLTVFLVCWTPFHYVSYLHFDASLLTRQQYYYRLSQWLCIMPLMHSAVVDPCAYWLLQLQYKQTSKFRCDTLARCGRCLTGAFRRGHRNRRCSPSVNGNNNNNRTLTVAETVEMTGMDRLIGQQNGRVNMAFHSDYF